MRHVAARRAADGRVLAMPDIFGRLITPASVLIGVAMHGDVPPRSAFSSHEKWQEGIAASHCELVTVDTDGALWRCGHGPRKALARMCVEGFVAVYPTLGQLVQAIQRGHVLGLLPELAPKVAVPWRSL